jgi:hypothetical protein
VLSEGAASLLPGQWTPAVLWTLDLDADGALSSTHVARGVVQHTYADVPAELASDRMAAIGARRGQGATQAQQPSEHVRQTGVGLRDQHGEVLDGAADASLVDQLHHADRAQDTHVVGRRADGPRGSASG